VRISTEIAVLTARPTSIRAVYAMGGQTASQTLEAELLAMLSEEVDRQRALDVERSREPQSP
jgi:hypothetical protein